MACSILYRYLLYVLWACGYFQNVFMVIVAICVKMYTIKKRYTWNGKTLFSVELVGT